MVAHLPDLEENKFYFKFPLSHFYVFKVRVFSFPLMKANKKRCVSMVHNGKFYILYKKLKLKTVLIVYYLHNKILLVVHYKLLLTLVDTILRE